MTTWQEKMIRALEKRGIEVISEHYDGHKNIDIFLPDVKIAIEIDGLQHVEDPKQIIADFSREHYSDQNNIHTMHIVNSVVDKHSEEIADALAIIVNEQKPRYQLHDDLEKLKK